MGDTVEDCIKLSNQLRNNNINTTVYFEDTKFKNKISFASKSQIPYAIFVGEDEVKNGYFTLKDLNNFTQEQLSLNEIINVLK